MAASTPVGVDHPTVVPTNFERESEQCSVCGRPVEECYTPGHTPVTGLVD